MVLLERGERLRRRPPAERRDASRLLVFDRTSGEIQHSVFNEIGSFLPQRGLLVRNAVSVRKPTVDVSASTIELPFIAGYE